MTIVEGWLSGSHRQRQSLQALVGRRSVADLDGEVVNGVLASFEDLKPGRTNVRHKPPHLEFSKVLQTRVWNRTEFVQESRVGGAQKCNGFFASFQREVGKRPLNAVGLCPSRYEELMSRRVRMVSL